MKYPSYFIVLSQIVLIPLISIGHWIYNYKVTIFEENNLLKGQLLTYPLMGIMLSLLWPQIKEFMEASYAQHKNEVASALYGKYSIKSIIDKLDDDDNVEIADVCTHACIFDLKAGRDIIKSKKPNSKSDGFPFIEDEELEKAMSIANVKYAENLRDKKKLEQAKEKATGHAF